MYRSNLRITPPVSRSTRNLLGRLGFDLIAAAESLWRQGKRRFFQRYQGILFPDGSGAGLTKLFNRLGNSSSQSILTYASICGAGTPGCDVNVTDDNQTVWAMAQFGPASRIFSMPISWVILSAFLSIRSRGTSPIWRTIQFG